MDSPKKHQILIDLSKSQEFLGTNNAAKTVIGNDGGEQEEQKISFFGSISKNKETTWVVSLFVFIHIVVFFSTLVMNSCWAKSHGDCVLMVFQPLAENPFLGPSPSVLDRMGAVQGHGIWRLFSSPLLHAGAFHLVISLASVIFIGINLERKYGPWRTAIIYLLSAFVGSLMASLFVQNSPNVCSSGALFGLIGASFSGLLRDWELYTNKIQAVTELLLVLAINFAIGLLPFVDNFSNIAGFVSGFLIGCVLFFSPQLRKPALHKGLFDYGVNKSVSLKQMLDKPVLRTVSLVLLLLMVSGLLLAVFYGINATKYCPWCQYVDCVPSRKWVCDIKVPTCKTIQSGGQTTLTCLKNDKFRILSSNYVSAARLEELCSLLCS
ncbi:inactive RHOMBOID-like protein 8 [Silene latifolia]|uniref:inactive RHOMBOID-like protein 8 n=1 Tax=Silene latifolia TaxID=37657 RepID=UPI003D77B1DC